MPISCSLSVGPLPAPGYPFVHRLGGRYAKASSVGPYDGDPDRRRTAGTATDLPAGGAHAPRRRDSPRAELRPGLPVRLLAGSDGISRRGARARPVRTLLHDP